MISHRKGVLLDGIGAELVRSSNGGRRKTLSQWLANISDEIATTFTSGDATPSVLNGTQFITAGSTAITDFDDAVEGQVIYVYRGGSDITITRDGASIETLDAASITLTATHPMAAFRSVSGVWQEVERSDSVIKATGGNTKKLSDWFALINNLGSTAISSALAAVVQSASLLLARAALLLDFYYTPEQYGCVGDGSTDDTTNMQACWDAAAAAFRPVRMPAKTYIVQGLSIPSGLMLFGAGNNYGLGTRLKLKASAATYIAATSGYVSNSAAVTYGGYIENVFFDGNSANNSGTAATTALLVLRTYRQEIANCTFYDTKGRGVLLTPLSANATVINNGMAENHFFNCNFDSCQAEGFYGEDGASSKLADFDIESCNFNACGGGATKKISCYIERGSGVKILDNQFYGSGKGELYVDKAGRTIIVGNHFDISSAGQTSGTVNTVEMAMASTSGHAHAVVAANLFHNSKASAGAVTWQHLSIAGGGANTIVTVNGNTFYSHSYSMTGIAASGTAAITDGANRYYQCTQPSPSATFRRVLESNSAGTWTITEALGLGGFLTQSIAGGSAAGWQASGEGAVANTLIRYSADATPAGTVHEKARGTIASPGDVVQFDELSRWDVYGYGASAFRNAGHVKFFVWAATPSGTDMEAQYRVSLAAAGSVSPTEILRLQHATGLSMFGANVVIDASRGIRFPVYTATNIADKTHAVNTAQKAQGKAVYDSTNHRLMVADGSTDVSNWYVADGSASVTPA